MSESEKAVLVEVRGRVLVITLNRPEHLNSINNALTTQLWDAVQRLDADPLLTAAVVTGNGRAFCAGMDLKAFAKGEDLSTFMRFIKHGSDKPLLAAIEGFALGGGLEIALACDLLIASRDAKLGIPEASVGLFAAAGGLLRLPGRIGYGKAMEMAITAQPITADEAFEHGLVTRVAEPGESLDVALSVAEQVARNAPLAVAASKQLIRAAQNVTETDFWALQKEPYARVFRSSDAKEGPRAFAQKRPPEWSGR